LTEFFEKKDTELLLEQPVEAERFSDYNIERSMDKIFETTSTENLFYPERLKNLLSG
jgi:hypothetical protein